jgi:hypothetical protein
MVMVTQAMGATTAGGAITAGTRAGSTIIITMRMMMSEASTFDGPGKISRQQVNC